MKFEGTVCGTCNEAGTGWVKRHSRDSALMCLQYQLMRYWKLILLLLGTLVALSGAFAQAATRRLR